MIFLKGLFGGVIATILMWVIIAASHFIRVSQTLKNQGVSGLHAEANGWDYLLHLPVVMILLTLAFGAGLWLAAR